MNEIQCLNSIKYLRYLIKAYENQLHVDIMKKSRHSFLQLKTHYLISRDKNKTY